MRRRLDAGDSAGFARVTVPVLVRLVAACDHMSAGVRNRCALPLGMASPRDGRSWRQFELRDVERRSKTDQEAQGHVVGVPYGSQLETCPVTAYLAWLEPCR